MSVPHGIDRSGAPGGSGAQGMVGSLNDLSDPGADRILFWDDSVGDLQFLSLGTGLSITGTSLGLSATLQALHGLTPADGNFIVGDGSTWITESGATARASLGITEAPAPEALGEFIFGRTASNNASAKFPANGHPLVNGYVDFSVSSGILTVSLFADGGAAPTASNPVWVRIRQGNPEDGTYAWRVITSALSMTVSSGSTLGHSNAVASAVYVYAIDNAGTIELAVSSKFFGDGPQSTTAEGGAGGADSQSTLYSTTARTSVPIAPILRWQSTQTTAGTWAAVTGIRQLFPFPYKAPTRQVFTSSGTYTRPGDAFWVEPEVQAAGGGGGGADASTTADAGAGSSGGGGSYSRKVSAAHDITPTVTVTVGAGGTAGSGTNGTAGGTGGSSSFGAYIACDGGVGGAGSGVSTADIDVAPGASGGVVATPGDFSVTGSDGTDGFANTNTFNLGVGGSGGASFLGGGGRGGAVASSIAEAGEAGSNYGGGGGGAVAVAAIAGAAGGAGAQGIVIVTEYYT